MLDYFQDFCVFWQNFAPFLHRSWSWRQLHVGAHAVVHHLLHGVGADQFLVEAVQVGGQLQVLLLHSPVADPAAAVAQPLRMLQVEGQRAAGAGRAEGVDPLAPARRRRRGVAAGPVGLGEEGGRVRLELVAVVLRRGRRGRSAQSQGPRGRHGGQFRFLVVLLRLLRLAAVILHNN